MEPSGLCILVVDDEVEICRLLADILEADGHRVTCAHDAHTARELLISDPSAFDLVLLDYRLPGEDGLSLLERLRSIRRGLRVALLSGDTNLKAEGHFALLAKPFSLASLEALTASVRRDQGAGRS